MKKLKQKTYDLLRWSEKYTKTDMVYIFKSGSWLTLGQIITTILGFLLAVAFANLLSKETYGTYKYILSIVGLLTIPSLSGINIAITRAISQGNEGSFLLGLKTKIKWGLLGSLASIIVAGYYYYLAQNNILALAFLSISIFIPFINSLEVYTSILNGRKLFDSRTKYWVANYAFSALSIATALLVSKNLLVILFVYFLSNIISRVVSILLILKRTPLNRNTDPQTISYGKHLSLIGVIGTIADYADRVLIFNYLGAVELAVYSFALLPVEQLKGFLKSAKAMAFPKLAVRPTEEIKKNIASKMLKFAIFIATGVIIYIVLAPLFYELVFPQYTDAVFYSQIFAISLIAAINVLPVATLEAKMAKKQLYKVNLCTSLMRIFLLFTLIHFWGLMGAILARVFGRFFSLGVTYVFLRRI